jgi:hypothetical protein
MPAVPGGGSGHGLAAAGKPLETLNSIGSESHQSIPCGVVAGTGLTPSVSHVPPTQPCA